MSEMGRTRSWDRAKFERDWRFADLTAAQVREKIATLTGAEKVAWERMLHLAECPRYFLDDCQHLSAPASSPSGDTP